MKRLAVLLLGVALMVPSVVIAKLKAPDVLDTEKIMTDESLARYKTVGIKVFSTDGVSYDNVDDEEMKKMPRFLKDCQKKLARTIEHDLEDSGVKAVVIDEDSKDTGNADMIIEGKFTKVNLGSFGARFWVGMGAGQAGVTVEGQIKDAKTGETLVKFEHENTSGLSGGEKWDMVLHECEDLGDKIAEFIHKLSK